MKTGMRRNTAVLSTLELTADWARWSADHVLGRQPRTTSKGKGGLPSCHPLGVDTGHPPTGSRRSPEGAHQVTTPVVLAQHGA